MSQRLEQFPASLGAGVTGFGTQRAMLIVVAVVFALPRTYFTGLAAAFHLGCQQTQVGVGLPRHEASRDIAHVGAVPVRLNTVYECAGVVFGEAGIRAAHAGVGAVVTGVNALHEYLIVSLRSRMRGYDLVR